MNVQRQEVDALVPLVASPVPAECADIEPLIAALSAARTPLVLAGGGVRSSGAVGALRRFVEQFQIPVVTSLMGVDVLPFGHPERVGLIGSYGNRWGNLVMAEADLLLILGARLDVRQTGADLDAFRSGKTIVQVDLDEKQLEWRITPDIAIRSDIGTFLAALEERSAGISCATREEWHRRIAEIVGAWPIDGESRDVSGIDPLKVVERLAEAIPTARRRIRAGVGLEVPGELRWYRGRIEPLDLCAEIVRVERVPEHHAFVGQPTRGRIGHKRRERPASVRAVKRESFAARERDGLLGGRKRCAVPITVVALDQTGARGGLDRA